MGASKGVNLGQGEPLAAGEAGLGDLPGADILKKRMAGELLTDLGSTTSLAAESSKVKYTGDQFSKAPTSQYLGQSARPLV